MKNCKDALKYPSLYARQKKSRKTECLCREGYISPMCIANPREPIVTPFCMWGLMGDIITHTQFQLSWFKG